MFLPEENLKKKIEFDKEKNHLKSTLNRVKSNPRLFKSPDQKLQKNRLKKNIA
jgi:hypothetical protein